MPETKVPKSPTSKRLVLQAVDHSHDVTFQAGRADLLASEADKLVQFLNRRARASRYTVYIAPNAPYQNAKPTLGDDRAETVSGYLEGRGFHTRVIPTPRIHDEARSGLRVVVRSFTVTLPGCPDWTSPAGDTHDNVVHSNLGCSTAINLGLMVADPGDLARGRELGTTDSELLTKRIRDYRKGETKSLDPEDVGTIESQQKTGSGGGGS